MDTRNVNTRKEITRKKGVNLLLVAEVLALVAVLVLGIFYGAAGLLKDEDNNTNINVDNNQNNNDFGDEDEDQDAGYTIPEDYTEGRITFSEGVEEKLASMTTEEKVAQLFIVSPEALTGYDRVTIFGNASREAFNQYPVGGLVYSPINFQNAEQTQALLKQAKYYCEEMFEIALFTVVEEEGGEKYSPFAATLGLDTGSLASEIGALNDEDIVSQAAQFRAEYIHTAEFNVMFSTIADVSATIETEYQLRTFGTDVDTVAKLIAADITAIENSGVASTLKYFPGKANADKMETGVLFSSESLTELSKGSLKAFKAGIDAGASFVMIGNVIVPSITEDTYVPCTLSGRTVALLRGEMGFEGVIVSDNFSDASFVAIYGNGEACVEAIKAGIDMIYMPSDFATAYQAVLDAVNNGNISEDRLNNAVGRILTEKGL